MKLVHTLAPLFLFAVGSIGCASLAPYGGMMAQPGAAPANAASPASAAGSPATPGSPAAAAAATNEGAAAASTSSVSVNIRNSCGKTVKVFFGEKPKFGSGTYSSASSNSVSSHTFRPGDLFWIVDESENGVASVTVESSTKEIEIRGACSELASR
jgi:nucleoid-associated protein YgaU